jgi:hypothetical protein
MQPLEAQRVEEARQNAIEPFEDPYTYGEFHGQNLRPCHPLSMYTYAATNSYERGWLEATWKAS